MNDNSDAVTQVAAQHTSDEAPPDPRTIASAAAHDCPAWAEDLIVAVPDRAVTSSVSMGAGAIQAGERTSDVTECPLHTAMQHLTEAAVTQHVLYLEGEVRPRLDLINTISRWERMHTLIRECICPATREVALGPSALAEIVDTIPDTMFAPGQQHRRTLFIQALAVCAACASSAECPLGAVPISDFE